MKFIFLFLVFCFTDAKQLSCDSELCTFSGYVRAMEYANMSGPAVALFDADTRRIEANAFVERNIASVIFESTNIDIDDNAFNFNATVTVICEGLIIRNVYPKATINAEYVNLCKKCDSICNV